MNTSRHYYTRSRTQPLARIRSGRRHRLLLLAGVASALLAAPACGPVGGGTDDSMMGSADLAKSSDLAVEPDLTVPAASPDLAALPDLTALADLTALPDLSLLPDLGALLDLSALPDLRPLPDLTAPPDMARPIVIPRYSTSGTVNAVLHAGNAWYVGGSFDRISEIPAAHLLPLDPTGTPTNCPINTGFDDSITALATSGNSVYVVGAFSHYQGLSANRIAKIDATTCVLDQTFSPPASNGFDGLPLTVGVSANAVYVGGQFNNYRGASANRIAKLDLTTGALDTTFSPPGINGFNNNVLALVIANSSVYCGGTFSTYRGVANSASHLAKLDLTTGAIDTTFSPVGVGTNGFSDTVTVLAASNTSLYVGGYFSDYRGVANSANRFGKVDLVTGVLDTVFSPPGAQNNGFDDVVFSLAVSADSVYVGGRFVNYRGVAGAAIRVAKLDRTTGALDVAFNRANSGISGQVTALVLLGNSLFVGGSFTSYRNVANSAFNLAKLDPLTGAQDLSYLPSGSVANGPSGGVGGTAVYALAAQGTTLWMGGRFTVYGGYPVSNFVKLDDRTFAVDTAFSPAANNGFNGAVAALATADTSLYVGGSFTRYQGVDHSAHRLARLDLATGALDINFSPPGANNNGVDNNVLALAVSGSSLYLGGQFSAYRGVAASANGLAKVDLVTGALDTNFGPAGANGFDGSVQALAVSASSLYAGGSFSAYRGVAGSASRLARLDLVSGALDTTFSPPGAAANGFDAVVNALAVSGGALYVGGAFLAYRSNADSAHRLARLDLTSGAIDAVFSPTTNANANGFDATVNALSVVGGALYVGGNFTAYRGSADTAHRLARLDPTSGAIDAVFSPPGVVGNGFDGPVNAVGGNGAFLMVGGSFSLYKNATTSTRCLALLDPMTGALK